MTGARSLDDIRQAVYRQWREIALSTGFIDRARARSAVEALYTTAIGRPPSYILFLESPLEAALASSFFPHHCVGQPLRPIGQWIRPTIGSKIGGVPDEFFDRMIGRRLSWHYQVPGALEAVPIADRRLRSAGVFKALIGQLPPLVRKLLVTPARGRERTVDAAAELLSVGEWMSLAAYHDYRRAAFPDRAQYRSEEALVSAITEVCKNCGWCALYEDLAIVTERPALVQLDAADQLHAEGGPALAYRDGFSVFALRGMRVQRRLVDRPDQISVSDVENQLNPRLRRVLLERMGYRRYLTLSGAEAIARDESGTLWRRRLSNIGPSRREWRFVEVINGTAEANGSHRHYYLQVPPTMRWAREAVAWTYGLGVWDYQPLIRT